MPKITKLTSKSNEIAVYMPRRKMWRVSYNTHNWEGRFTGRANKICGNLNIPLFLEKGTGWPGCTGYFEIAKGTTDSWAINRVTRWK